MAELGPFVMILSVTFKKRRANQRITASMHALFHLDFIQLNHFTL